MVRHGEFVRRALLPVLVLAPPVSLCWPSEHQIGEGLQCVMKYRKEAMRMDPTNGRLGADRTDRHVGIPPTKQAVSPEMAGSAVGRSAVALLFVVVFIWTIGVSAVFAADADFRYLAADPSLRGALVNAGPQMGQATYVGKMLELDQPWEDPFQMGYVGSVVNDPASGQWRMYYCLGSPRTGIVGA